MQNLELEDITKQSLLNVDHVCCVLAKWYVRSLQLHINCEKHISSSRECINSKSIIVETNLGSVPVSVLPQHDIRIEDSQPCRRAITCNHMTQTTHPIIFHLPIIRELCSIYASQSYYAETYARIIT